MPVRRFNGSTDLINFALPANLTGAFTIAVFCRSTGSSAGGLYMQKDATTERLSFAMQPNQWGSLFTNAAATGSELGEYSLNAWQILCVSKASGTAAPRWSRWNTSVTSFANDGTSINNALSQAGGSMRIGHNGFDGAFEGDIAAVAVWAAVLSDSDREALGNAASLMGWKTIGSPVSLYHFRQASVTEEVKDLIGTAHQTSRTGTTSIEAEPPIPYEAGKTVEFSASTTSSSSLSAGLLLTREFGASIDTASTLAAALLSAQLLHASIASASSIASALELEGGGDGLRQVLFAREFPRLDLHYEAETPRGRFYRWAKDEPDPANVASGGGFSTSMPGGFDTMRVTLPRKPAVDYADLERLTTIRALGPGGEIASEVRLQEAPRRSGGEFSIGPEAVGWRAHLEDATHAAEIYRDKDLGGWSEASRARHVAISEANVPLTGAFEVLSDVSSGLPALHLHLVGQWEAPLIPAAEAWYDAGGSCKVARVYYEHAGWPDTAFVLEWFSSSSDASVDSSSGDVYSAASGTTTAEPTPRRYFGFNWRYSATPAGTEGLEFNLDLRRVAVEGAHGLPKQGTEPEAGYLASDVIANAVSRWAPLLNFTTGITGTIRPSAFVIPHLAFKEKTTPQVIVEGANRYELRPYAVWENRTFHYHDWGERGRRWRGRLAPTQLAETGPSVGRLRNGVIMTWSDVDGSQRFAGPIGSGCDVEDASLEDSDPENPANQRGAPFYGPPVSMDGVSVASEAVRVGALILERFKEADTSGQAQIVGACEDDKGILRPAWQVRAGDYFEPIDAADRRARRIIRTDYDESSLTNTITLDSPPDEPEDLFAQLGVSVADLGL